MSEDLPLLLLHPIAQDTACWRLAGFDTTHAYTYPGHGGLPRRALSLAELADDAAGSVEGRFDLLGVAMGSIVGQHVLLRHGDRVRSAVLACRMKTWRPGDIRSFISMLTGWRSVPVGTSRSQV